MVLSAHECYLIITFLNKVTRSGVGCYHEWKRVFYSVTHYICPGLRNTDCGMRADIVKSAHNKAEVTCPYCLGTIT